ncbi:hypothetical protein T484DRAFT_1803602, partial [Baffinella frigidus]
AFDVDALGRKTEFGEESEDTVGVAVRILPVPRITGVRPGVVGMTGSSGFTMTGRDFGLRDLSVVVSIGETRAMGSAWVSDTFMTVRTPASADVTRSFFVSMDVPGGLVPEPSNYSLSYVSAWHTLAPAFGSVTGYELLTLSGGHFDSRDYFCVIGDVQRPATVQPGGTSVTCWTPHWTRPAGLVQIELLVDGIAVHRDASGQFEFLAGPPTQLVLGGAPEEAFGGEVLDNPFEVVLLDEGGNVVRPFNGTGAV